MTSLVSNALSPSKDGTASLPRRQSSFARPPLRALYDLLIAPMEGVSARGCEAPWRQSASPVLGALALSRTPGSAQLLRQRLEVGCSF